MGQEDQTITWWSTRGYKPNSAYATADDSPFHSILKEMLGVNIEWMFPTAGSDDNQAFNLMMASDTLPDIIFHPLLSDAGRYMSEGTIWDLTPYMEQHAPAYYKWIKSKDEYDRAMKTDDGKYFGFGFFREGGGWNDTYIGPTVNETWLSELNLKPEDIKTIDDWDKMLEGFKQKHPDASPLSFAKSRINDCGIAGAFGAYTMLSLQPYIDSSNKVQLANIQPEWKEYISKIHEWWEKGYLDQDFLSDDDSAIRSKAQNLQFGASITSMGQISSWERDANDNNTGAKWVALSYPRDNEGKISMVFSGGYAGIGNDVAVVSKNCPESKLPLVLRCLDYAYTDEGFLYWNYGKEGNSWEYDANHEVQYLPIVTEDPNGVNGAIDKFGGSTYFGCCIQANKLIYMKNTEASIACNDKWFYENEDVAYSWKIPNVSYTAEESTRIAELRGAMQTYVEETAVKYITGEESLDSFDSFVETIKGMNVDELLSIYQAAVDRYLAR